MSKLGTASPCSTCVEHMIHRGEMIKLQKYSKESRKESGKLMMGIRGQKFQRGCLYETHQNNKLAYHWWCSRAYSLVFLWTPENTMSDVGVFGGRTFQKRDQYAFLVCLCSVLPAGHHAPFGPDRKRRTPPTAFASNCL